MRRVNFALSGAAMQNGPYLVFARFGDGLDPMQDDLEWPFLSNLRAEKLGCGTIRSPDSIVTHHEIRDEIVSLTEVPDEATYIEIASVSLEHATPSFSPGMYDWDGYEEFGMCRLTHRKGGGGYMEKPCFHHRLILVWFYPEVGEDVARQQTARVRAALGSSAAVVWPAKAFAGLYASSRESCQAIVDRLSREVRQDAVYDFGVFRLAGSACAEPLSPLGIAMSGDHRTRT